MASPFVHVELHTRDLPKAKAFYAGLFGWDLQDMPMPGGGGTYTMINVGEGTGGGMMQEERSDAVPYWLAYVGVVLQDVLAVGDFGLMSVIRDPAGATVAMWQAVGGK